MKLILLSVGLILVLGGIASAQQPAQATKKAGVSPAPESFEAKYEGGMFGFKRAEHGTLKFEDENKRLVFFGDDQQERFHIPYHSVDIVYPESPGHQGASVGSLVKGRRYLVIHYADPDVESAKGIVNFGLGDKKLLASVLAALAERAKLVQRGDTYYRPRSKVTKSSN